MDKVFSYIGVSIAVLFLVGCSGAKLTHTVRSEYSGPPIRAIALGPGGGVFADAVGVELFNNGLTVIDPQQTMEIIGEAGLTQLQITSDESYNLLADAGVDALLIVKAVMADDGTPESASVRLTSTHTSEIVAGMTWQNGWGGQRGSIADRMQRQNLAEAAAHIAGALVKRLE